MENLIKEIDMLLSDLDNTGYPYEVLRDLECDKLIALKNNDEDKLCSLIIQLKGELNRYLRKEGEEF